MRLIIGMFILMPIWPLNDINEKKTVFLHKKYL